MHPVLFSVKRAYWSANLRMIELTKPFGLTPARTDLMRIVAIHGDAGVPQWKVVRLLGCCASVVSRMLGSLEDLEFVDRTGDPRDPRKKIVHLTREGWIRLSKVMRLLVDKNEVGLRVNQAYGGRDEWRKRGGLFERLNGVRRVFWDRSPFLHPWRREHVIDEEKDSPIHPKQRLQLDDFDDSRPDEEVLREVTVQLAAKPMTKNFFEAHGCLKIFRDGGNKRRQRSQSRDRAERSHAEAPHAAPSSGTSPEAPPSEGTLQRWLEYVQTLDPGSPIPAVTAFRETPPPESSAREAPTATPREAPTAAPREAPTTTPREAPTVAPREAPTAAPREAPTVAPREAPTVAPREAPTIGSSDANAAHHDEAPQAAPSEGTLQRWLACVEQLDPGAPIPSVDAFRR